MKFEFCNPTDIRFGKGQIAALETLVPEGARILLLYGGGSIKENGVYEQVRAALSRCHVTEFGGVEPNPRYETLQNAAEVAREAGCDMVLGVGGGSVVDAAKFLAAMVPTGKLDPWPDLVAGRFPDNTLPVGCVLTLPATGSESNPVSVVSSSAHALKLPFANPCARPRFAILDPSVMASLSRRQLENGVVDAFTHVVEQYLTRDVTAPIQHGFSETIMRTLIEWGPKLVSERSEEAQETVMWAANQALNGLIGAGVPQDWSTHMIGHAITAIYGIDHARTLSAVMPAVLRHKAQDKHAMLVRYGREVWRIDHGTEGEIAAAAIAQTEGFFRTMGCPARLGELGVSIDPEAIVEHLERAGQTELGEDLDIRPPEVRKILATAI